MRELVTNGADLHAVLTIEDTKGEKRSETPFLRFFMGGNKRFWGSCPRDPSRFEELVKIWLEDLDTCGVNLLEYGRKEKALHDEFPMQDFMGDCFKDYHYHEIKWHLISFSFGTSVSDWRIWVSEPSDGYAGDFWSMIEPPELSIPGMWIE